MAPEIALLSGDEALASIAEVRRACLEHDRADPLDEAAHLRLKHDGLEGIGAWVTRDGFALRRGPEVDLAVAPQARGAGLGGSLAALACADSGGLTAWSHGDHPAAGRLAERLGFARQRELWVMRRPTAVPLPAAEPPAGVHVRDYGDRDAAALLEVNAAAFAHHPEQGSLDAAGLAERMAEPWFDPAGLLLAVGEGGELLGFHWTKQHDRHTGEVYVVGIAPEAQGRGLGRVLTLAGLHHLTARGVQEILLYVESDNTAARRLYEGLAFSHAPEDTHVQYRRA
ncbi:mycothiol synthase [Nocardioides sp. SYSU DS0651]|uniref:mycothiol synthase n=1 Tax=Nocardioides sp. SYSU DS0651 TaxID=3415955 RepID=UPI003F4BDB74